MTETKAAKKHRPERTVPYEWSSPKETWPRAYHVQRMTRSRFVDKEKRLYVMVPTTGHFASEWAGKQLQSFPRGARLFWVLPPADSQDPLDLPVVHKQRFVELVRPKADSKEQTRAQRIEIKRQLMADDAAHAEAKGTPVAGCTCICCADGVPLEDLFKGEMATRIDNVLKVNASRAWTLHSVVSLKSEQGKAPARASYVIMSPVASTTTKSA